jgi:signal transduction histidine kinase
MAEAGGHDTDLQILFTRTGELLRRIRQQTLRLDRLVSDLLDISRIQTGQLELRPERCDLATVVREMVEEQQQIHPAREIGLSAPRGQSLPVHADRERIGQVVTNFLTNALKYSREDRPVHAGIEEEEHDGARWVRVWVRDEGPGLAPEDQEIIWERFSRAQGVEIQSGSGVGLGLGLYISRTIIERHGGRIGVESARGEGSTFWFSLPRLSAT